MGITLPCRLSQKNPWSTKKIPEIGEIKQHETYSQSQCYWNHHISVSSTASFHRSNLVSTDVQDSPWLEDVEFCGAKKGRVWLKNPLGELCKAKAKASEASTSTRSSKMFYNLRWFFHSVGTDTLRNCKTRPSTCCWPSLSHKIRPCPEKSDVYLCLSILICIYLCKSMFPSIFICISVKCVDPWT